MNLLWLLVFSTAGGMALHALGVTAGALIGSMFGGTIYSVRAVSPFPSASRWACKLPQELIGFRVQQETIVALGTSGSPLSYLQGALVLASVS